MTTTDKLTAVDFGALQTDPGYMLELYFGELRNSHARRSVVDSTTSNEVSDLRQQIRHLTAELQYLRTNLRDDHRTLPPGNLARTPFRHSVTSLPTIGGRPDMKHATSFPSIVEEAAVDVAPTLPPRTYRGPPKPQRTFEELPPLVEQFHQQHAPFLPPKSPFVLEKQQQVQQQQHQLTQNVVVRRFPAVPPPPPIQTRASSTWDASSIQPSPISDRPFRRTNSARPREIGSAPSQLPSQLIMPPKELWTATGNLTALREPVTAGSIAKELEASFKKGVCWFELGPLKLFVNPFNDLAETQTSSYRSIIKLTKELRNCFNDVGSQSIVFCGESGSGKSYLCQQLIKQLCMEFGAADSDLLKTRTATMTVLRSLGSSGSADNMHASKIQGQGVCSSVLNCDSVIQGFWYEYQIIDGVCGRVKINCCFTDMSRLTARGDGHAFDVFYEMLTGLSAEEKVKFHLGGMDASKLRYLKEGGSTVDGRRRFNVWKSALFILGIPFSDVMRVLAACLLLGNVQFIESEGEEVELEGQHELESVAALLGLSALSLYKALTKRTKQTNGHKVKTTLSAESANRGRDELATSLYQRCVSAIARRANSMQTSSQPKICHNGNGSSGISSSDGESSVHDSGIGLQLKADYSRAGDGVISVFDLFGLTDGSHNTFETLCINLVSEKLRQFYQARTFLDVQSKMTSEGVRDSADVQLQEGPEVLEAFLAPKIGLLYLLDEECEKANGSPSHFLDNVKTQQKEMRSFSVESHNLLVRHYGSRSIRYDCSSIVAINRNRLAPDLVSIFNKNSCNFGFVSYLFTSDVEACAADSSYDAKIVPFVGPAGHTGSRPATFSEDFAYQVDSFLRAAAIGKLHFVHCIKSNSLREYHHLDADLVRHQVTRSDLVQMFSVVSAGFPYTLTVEEFNERYRFLLRKYYPTEPELADDVLEKTKLILDCFLKAVDESSMPYVSNQWALGKKHIFLSHGAQQQLNILKLADSSARPSPNSNNDLLPTLTPEQLLRKTAATLGIEPSAPPPLPANRLYTVNGSRKHCFPQRRVMVEKFTDPTTGAEFRAGDVVTVLGVSANSTHLVISSGSGRTSIVPARSTRLTVRS